MHKTKAKTVRKVGVLNFLLPKYAPAIPPIIAAISINEEDVGKVPPFVTNPKRPAIELTKINNAETAAVCFMVAHPKRSSTGLKIIPPPIPISPDINPITAPMNNAKGMLMGLIAAFPFPNKPNNLATANSKTVAKIILYQCVSMVIIPPRNENGIEAMANG